MEQSSIKSSKLLSDKGLKKLDLNSIKSLKNEKSNRNEQVQINLNSNSNHRNFSEKEVKVVI